MSPCSEDTPVTIDNFISLKFDSLASSNSYADMSCILKRLANQYANEDGQTPEYSALCLLADICDIKFESLESSDLQPDFFQKYIQYTALFSQFSEKVDHLLLQVRLVDVWFLLSNQVQQIEIKDAQTRQDKTKIRQLKKQHIDDARRVIDSYKKTPISMDSWQGDGKECWERAIKLCKEFNLNDCLEDIESILIKEFKNLETNKCGIFAVWLSHLLRKHSLGQKQYDVVATRLQQIAQYMKDEHSCLTERYFSEALEWYKGISKDISKVAEIKVCLAKIQEDKAQCLRAKGLFLNAGIHFKMAIKRYFEIPKDQRPFFNIDEHVLNIRKTIKEIQSDIDDKQIYSDLFSIDIEEIPAELLKKLEDKNSITDALKALTDFDLIRRTPQSSESEEDVVDTTICSVVVNTIYCSNDGRIVGNSNSEPTHEKIATYELKIAFFVTKIILPALDILTSKYPEESDGVFRDLASRVFPENRKDIVGRALFAGYQKNFVVALHLLVPQIEHLIRERLQDKGIKTSTLDNRDWREDENGLSTLVDKPEVSIIFGEDLAFELNALFCNAIGPNLRNELAHGLLDGDDCESVFSIYAWWFGLKLVFNTNLHNRN